MLICGDLCNLGDTALVLQNLGRARDEKRQAFVRQWGPLPPAVEAQVHDAGGVLVSGKRPAQFITACLASDMIVGGGQLVRDNASVASLLILVLGVFATRLGGGRVDCRGLGVGRCRSAIRRLCWRFVFRLSSRVAVRDEESASNAGRLTSSPIVQAADMAFLPGRLHDLMRAAGDGGSLKQILISPCIDETEGRGVGEATLEALTAAARRAMPNSTLVIACHDPRPGMDRQAADILRRLDALRDARVVDGYSLPELLREYSAASLVITNRLHALIFSLLMSRPVVVLDDGSGKTRAICRQFATPCAPIATEATASDFDAIVRAALSFDREARAERLRAAADLAWQNIGERT